MVARREPAPWTLEELQAIVERALSVDYEGQSSGKVRDVPDVRTIRYYTTLGLLDRPVMVGRTAHYGRRHLLQLVSVKRLQASGQTLASIQERLAGATTSDLEALARLPSLAPSLSGSRAAASDHPEATPAPPDDGAPGHVRGDLPATGLAEPRVADAARDRSAFWARAVALGDPLPVETRDLAPHAGARPERPERPERPGRPERPERPEGRPTEPALAPPLTGAPLEGGAYLLFPAARPLDADDLAAIRAAAEPLIHLLHIRGLLSAQPTRPARPTPQKGDDCP